MLVERRPQAAAPLCDLSVTESLRLRRRHGRAAYLLALVAYLLALVAERRSKQAIAAQPARQAQDERAIANPARTLPS